MALHGKHKPKRRTPGQAARGLLAPGKARGQTASTIAKKRAAARKTK